MKVIDLLNKIANGEEIPKEMCIQGDLFLKSDGTVNTYEVLEFLCKYDIKLNDEVEILEEEKKIPEKINTWFSVENVHNNGIDKTEFIIKYANHNFETYFNKINEIIDYLKSKGE